MARGEAGKTVVTYDSYIAFNVAKPSPDILSVDEFRRSRRGTDYGADTDWYGLITRDVAYDTNQYISIDGNTKNGFYGASFNYKSANGLDIVSGREEFGGRFFFYGTACTGESLTIQRFVECTSCK